MEDYENRMKDMTAKINKLTSEIAKLNIDL